MQYSEGRLGRIFILRLEDGERLNDTIEDFARERQLSHGLAFFLGGSGDGSKVVVGPEADREDIIPMIYHPPWVSGGSGFRDLDPQRGGGADTPHARRRRAGGEGHGGLHPGRRGGLADR